jgi:glucose-6-phosphate 1-dehydrogenase
MTGILRKGVFSMTSTDSHAVHKHPLEIIIVGASGDLTRKKLIPALFTLYSTGLLPEEFSLYGIARSALDDEAFRDRVQGTLTCRFDLADSVKDCDTLAEEFLSRCFYNSGSYDSVDDFRTLNYRLKDRYKGPSNRLVYMAVPPDIFGIAAGTVQSSGLLDTSAPYWSRIILEKPFGRDSESSAYLSSHIAGLFPEEKIYRIDHYLGKEVIQNLLILRFANLIFEPFWNNKFIERVSISFTEDSGIEGRGGYFDGIGIIRDVIQNHLLQIMALMAMDEPVSLQPRHIADAKTRLLDSIRPPTLKDTVLGRYEGYLDEKGVSPDSRTETYACTMLCVENSRWYGVPFELSAGKALNSRMTEIRVYFKDQEFSVFRNGGFDTNMLVIRIQPDEAIELYLNNKVPGLTREIRRVKLDMLYREAFNIDLPEAYERLLLDVIRGDKSLFIHPSELEASWRVVTPLLKEIEKAGAVPLSYPKGSSGPDTGDLEAGSAGSPASEAEL